MILHHVAQGTGVFIISRPALDPNRFGDGDLDMIDVRGIPQWFEERIGEAQRHQILHRLLAEIMIDAENALLSEDRANCIVDERCRTAVLADRTEMIGSRREVERTHALRIFLELVLETIPAQVAVDVEHDIMYHFEEA